MGERRAQTTRWRTRVIAAVVAAALVGFGATWFVVRDRESGSEAAGAGTRSADAPQTFKVDGVPFTFEYPADFAEAAAPAGFVWIAGISPSDILDVRRVDTRTYSAQGLATVMGSRLQLQTGATDLAARTVKAGDFDVVQFKIESGTGATLQSTLLFFSTEDATWQIECQAQEQNAGLIESACAQALSSLTPTEG